MPSFRQFTWGPAAFKSLHGVLCVYKPVGLTCTSMVTRLANRLTRGRCLNSVCANQCGYSLFDIFQKQLLCISP